MSVPQPIPAPADTEARLIDAAGEIFAQRGFQDATVREICALAGANVAAVNYHYGDKLGLYIATLKASMEASGPESALRVDENEAPEDALRRLVTGIVRRVRTTGRPGWHFRMMMHEMAQPTQALPRVVEEVIGPRHQVIREIISRLTGYPRDHELTRMCAHSVIGQVVHYVHGLPVIHLLWPEMKDLPDQTERIAEHITRFSLAGIRATASSYRGESHE